VESHLLWVMGIMVSPQGQGNRQCDLLRDQIHEQKAYLKKNSRYIPKALYF